MLRENSRNKLEGSYSVRSLLWLGKRVFASLKLIRTCVPLSEVGSASHPSPTPTAALLKLVQMKPAVGMVSSTKYKRSRWITTGAKAKE
jgi:hypothetical protein